jgi:ketosteroid isomerase-like protein
MLDSTGRAADTGEAMSQENVDVIRQGWDAWLRGDLPRLFRNFDPEIVWDTSHFHDWPEPAYHGIEGVERFLNEWLNVWDDYEVGVEDVMAVPDGRVVTLVRQRGKGRSSGLAMDMQMAQIATLRDGKVTRLDNYEDRDEALEAVGLGE